MILDGPESADGYIWWEVEYDYDDDPYAEYTGWCVQDWLEVIPLKFDIGDTVQTTANVNVRTGPGVSYPEISDPDYPGYAPEGSTGVILDGPKSTEDDGYIWWKVDYDAGYTGWSAQDWLEIAPLQHPLLHLHPVQHHLQRLHPPLQQHLLRLQPHHLRQHQVLI